MNNKLEISPDYVERTRAMAEEYYAKLRYKSRCHQEILEKHTKNYRREHVLANQYIEDLKRMKKEIQKRDITQLTSRGYGKRTTLHRLLPTNESRWKLKANGEREPKYIAGIDLIDGKTGAIITRHDYIL